MIIYGGEPPFIEKPEPRFGEVILRLDQMAYSVEQKVHSFNEGTKEALALFTENLTQFINDIVIPIDTHLNQTGPVHGEWKGTIGLSKKDNYRTATTAEQGALADVVAYVTPEGANQAFANRQASNAFVPDDYQQNDLLQFASYYYVNEYPTIIPTAVQGVRYFEQGSPVAMIFNDDRIMFYPSSNKASYQTDIGFLSMPTKQRRSAGVQEIQNLQSAVIPSGWNNLGGVTTDGKVTLFKPIADKKIFVFKDNLGDPAGGKNFLLFSSFAGTVYRGLSLFSQVVSDFSFGLTHKFFSVDAFQTDPTLVNLITGSYQALFTLVGQAPYQGALQGGHSYDIRNFVGLNAGQSIKIAAEGGSPRVVVALMWAIENAEIYMNVTVPVMVTNQDGSTKYLIINFTVSIIPGTLRSGGSGTVTVLGTRAADVLDTAGNPPSNAQYVFVTDRWDLNSPYNLPGVVTQEGDILRAVSTRNGIRVKRFRSGVAGLQAWLEGPRPRVDAKLAQTEMYSPSRHTPFGPVPERIIPLSNVTGVTRYLVYGLDNEKGFYRWCEVSWNSEDIVGSVVGARFGIGPPSLITAYPWLDGVPRGLSTYASKSSGGFATNSLVFTTENGYKAYSTFGYSEGVVTLGAEVKLSPASLLQLQVASKKVMANAKTRNPAIPDSVREVQIQVYALALGKAIAIISDGYSYAEGVALPYSVANGEFKLNLVGSSGIILQPLTGASNSLTGVNRKSMSGDDVWSGASDLLASQLDSATYDIVITKPFGAVYGDLSFRVGFLNNDLPTFTPYAVNPARLYAGTSSIDFVDELHPPILIASKGVYQMTPGAPGLATVLREVNNAATTVDPYNINEAGWVRIPAGSKIVLLGRVYVLDKDYPIKVKTSGTSYCYIQRIGRGLVAVASDVMREVSNSEVMFGTSVNGVLTVNESFIVMNNHVIRKGRRGSAIPVFEDDGGLGTNQFFTQRDVS